LPAELDETDVIILRALMKDGRKSYRQIAQAASVSTPTVESRVKRMMNMGIIKRIAPLLDPNKIELGIIAIVTLRVETPKLDNVATKLAELEDVRNICMTTGENNLTIRIVVENVDALNDFLSTKIAGLEGVTVVSSNIVTKTIKEEQEVVIRPRMGLRLICDFCGAEIKGEPQILRIDDQERYFCCKTCLEQYKEKYGARMRASIKP
jgi:DNA-binding Lrp family transcriptional regulator